MSPATPCLLFLLLAASGTLPAADLIPSPPAAATDGAIAVEADARQRLAFEPAPITGGACYRLVFEARAAGSPLLENNPRIHVARFENPRLFWRWEIAQADATNAANLYLLNGGRTIKMVTVPADGMLEFVPPAGTTSGFFKIYNSYLEAVRIVPLDE